MPKFCKECKSLLTPNYKSILEFKCEQCNLEYPSEPSDTLRYEMVVDNRMANTERYNVFLNNAAFDDAGRKVNTECEKCHAPYVTLTYVGPSMQAIYVCVCGSREDVAKNK